MSKPDEKFIYRIKAQTKDNGITITAQISKEVSHKEAVENATKDVFSQPMQDHYSNFIVEPICTEEEWKEGTVSFCPRCGANIRDYELGKGTDTDCMECGATFEAYILSTNLDESEEG